MHPSPTPIPAFARQIIVGISGYKQSGKDTTASLIRANFPALSYFRIAFADALKDEICSIFGTSRQEIEKDKEKWRYILQDHGQRAKETRGELVWVTEASKKIQLAKNLGGADQLIIIPDVRFPFEAKWLQELGGFLIKVERYEETEDTHPSETEVTKIRNVDYFLPNKGSLRDLERECKWVSAAIRERYRIL